MPMPLGMSKRIHRVRKSTAKSKTKRSDKLERRELLTAQIYPLGFGLSQDPTFADWSNVELGGLRKALLGALSKRSGEDDEDDEDDDCDDEKEGEGVTSGVTSGRHVPGVNDFMTGALPPRQTPKSKDSDIAELDDATVSLATLPHLYRSMPHYMVSVDVLKTFNLFLNPTTCNNLPENFFTTIKGLKRAWEEADAKLPDATEDMDQRLLEAIRKRGGPVEDPYWSVKYPSDIIPQIGEQWDVEFWREIRNVGLE